MSTTFPGHSLAWSQAKAADRLRSYRCIFAVSLGLDVLLGLLAIFGPVTLARLIGLPEPFHPADTARRSSVSACDNCHVSTNPCAASNARHAARSA